MATKCIVKRFIVTLLLSFAKCSIDGTFRPWNGSTNQYNPCNPLYWYPRNIPEHCYDNNAPSPPKPEPQPMPLLVPVPAPAPPPVSNMFPPGGLPFMPFSGMFSQTPPLPMPMPFIPPFMPTLYQPPGYYGAQIGMVPGVPGIVSRDGGINILPFTDVYSDMLERHKQKMARKRMEKFLAKYERRPWRYR